MAGTSAGSLRLQGECVFSAALDAWCINSVGTPMLARWGKRIAGVPKLPLFYCMFRVCGKESVEVWYRYNE